MKPININNVCVDTVNQLLEQQIIVSVFCKGNKIIWFKAYYFESESSFKRRYEIVSKDEILVSTEDLDIAINVFKKATQ